MTQQMINAENLPQIPSEYIEPYLKRWLMMELESVAYGMTTPAEMRESMKWMYRFSMRFCGIHAEYAAINEERRICSLTDDELIEIAKKTFD